VRWRERLREHGEPRHLVNTEPHNDHIRGNAYFPGVEVIGHERMVPRYAAAVPVMTGSETLEAVKAAYLLWLAFAVLSAIALGIASFSSSVVTGALTVLVLVVSYLKAAVTTYLALVTQSPVVNSLGQAMYYLLPNFENFNTRTAVVHDRIVPWAYLGRTSLYALALAAFFLYLGVQIFEEREF